MNQIKQLWSTWGVIVGLVGIAIVTALKAAHAITMGEWQEYCGAIGAFTGVGMHFRAGQGTAAAVIQAMKDDPAIPTNGPGNGK